MMNINRTAFQAVGIVAATLALALAGCGSGATTGSTTAATGSGTVDLNGAGSSFVNPAMSKWIDEYKKVNANVALNYASVGSGQGISNYESGLVDFGATDAPAKADDLKKMPPTIQIPVVSGAVAVTYNLPGVTTLKLSPDAVAGIFLGTIKKWNDPKIATDNAGTTLPDLDIAVAHRSDSSGTSFIFTNYLSAVSPGWKSGPGVGKDVDWPVGSGGKGNDGVAAIVQQTKGGVGYNELAYAINKAMGAAQVKNASGEFIAPSVDSTQIAVAGKIEDLKKDATTTIVNSTSKGAYPICGFTYVLVDTAPKDAAKSKALVEFLTWAIGPGQDMIKDLQYAPLPKELVDLNKTALSQVSSGK
jgi:phosphate transport system substrate-binding protein